MTWCNVCAEESVGFLCHECVRLYHDGVRQIAGQDIEDDLTFIDAHYGRERLKYGDGSDAVKAEALRQHRVSWYGSRARA